MKLLSIWRFSKCLRLVPTFLSVFLLTSSLNAQDRQNTFKGTWQINTPDRGSLIIILKNQGLAAYFWADNADLKVYPGTWKQTDGSATLSWSDRSQHRIEPDNLGFSATYLDTTGSEQYTTRAKQVPEGILGQWAKVPDGKNERTSDSRKTKGFPDIRKIIDASTADPYYIFIESDRTVAQTRDDLRGRWAKQGSELHITWENGDYSIFRQRESGFDYKQIVSGQSIENDEAEWIPAERGIEDHAPPSWMANYTNERASDTTRISFMGPKQARAFYRGNWIVQHSDEEFEQIRIGRFGTLKTSLDHSIGGNWKIQGPSIFMRWDDGMRQILRPIGRGFVLQEYPPGRPLDGLPSHIYPAALSNPAKLTKYLKGHKDVSRQVLDQAEATGWLSRQQKPNTWHRTFFSWLRPFKQYDSARFSEKRLQAKESEDPWWWPFWSEDKTADAEVGKETLEIEDRSRDAAEIPKSKKRKSAPDWNWPF